MDFERKKSLFDKKSRFLAHSVGVFLFFKEELGIKRELACKIGKKGLLPDSAWGRCALPKKLTKTLKNNRRLHTVKRWSFADFQESHIIGQGFLLIV